VEKVLSIANRRFVAPVLIFVILSASIIFQVTTT
jgi:hypothetical protein